MQEVIQLQDEKEALELFGRYDFNLKLIKSAFDINITARNNLLVISGSKEDVAKAVKVFTHLLKVLTEQGRILESDIIDGIESSKDAVTETDKTKVENVIKHVYVRPKTKGQAEYVKAVRDHDLVFCIGPAGTGKTYLAVALAVSALKSRRVKKIVLVRPAIEAGERLGFLPGDMLAKVNPYLRPLYDALYDMMDFIQVKKYIENDMIEVIPLAFMRGRTLNDCFIILDEAQNTTRKQMKMFLTRFGMDAKIIVTGDISQIDLQGGQSSGLIHAEVVLKDIKGIRFCYLGSKDIIRHNLVQKIVEAYDRVEKRRSKA